MYYGKRGGGRSYAARNELSPRSPSISDESIVSPRESFLMKHGTCSSEFVPEETYHYSKPFKSPPPARHMGDDHTRYQDKGDLRHELNNRRIDRGIRYYDEDKYDRTSHFSNGVGSKNYDEDEEYYRDTNYKKNGFGLRKKEYDDDCYFNFKKHGHGEDEYARSPPFKKPGFGFKKNVYHDEHGYQKNFHLKKHGVGYKENLYNNESEYDRNPHFKKNKFIVGFNKYKFVSPEYRQKNGMDGPENDGFNNYQRHRRRSQSPVYTNERHRHHSSKDWKYDTYRKKYEDEKQRSDDERSRRKRRRHRSASVGSRGRETISDMHSSINGKVDDKRGVFEESLLKVETTGKNGSGSHYGQTTDDLELDLEDVSDDSESIQEIDLTINTSSSFLEEEPIQMVPVTVLVEDISSLLFGKENFKDIDNDEVKLTFNLNVYSHLRELCKLKRNRLRPGYGLKTIRKYSSKNAITSVASSSSDKRYAETIPESLDMESTEDLLLDKSIPTDELPISHVCNVDLSDSKNVAKNDDERYDAAKNNDERYDAAKNNDVESYNVVKHDDDDESNNVLAVQTRNEDNNKEMLEVKFIIKCMMNTLCIQRGTFLWRFGCFVFCVLNPVMNWFCGNCIFDSTLNGIDVTWTDRTVDGRILNDTCENYVQCIRK